jgi:hypothetical protein
LADRPAMLHAGVVAFAARIDSCFCHGKSLL